MTPISEAEAVVMEVLWQQAPRSADDVVAALAQQKGGGSEAAAEAPAEAAA